MQYLNEKIDRALEYPIIGMFEFNEDELDLIKKKIQSVKNKTISQKLSYDIVKPLFIWLINNSKHWGEGDEKKYWSRMAELLSEGSNIQLTPEEISISSYDTYEIWLGTRNITLFRSKHNKRMVREVILFHALAPKSSVEALILLLWKIYVDEDGFNRQIVDDEPLFENIHKWLVDEFTKNEEDDDVNQEVAFEGKTYQIRAALKYGFKQAPTITLWLIKYIVEIIDYFEYGEYIEKSDIIVEACRRVYTRLGIFDTGSKKRASVKMARVDSFSKMKIQYLLNDESHPIVRFSTVICPPFEVDRCELKCFSGENVFCSMRLRIVGKGPKRRLMGFDFPIYKYLTEFKNTFDLSFKIEYENAVLYESNKSLYRDYLFFDKSNESRKVSNPIYQSYIVVFPSNHVRNELPYNFQKINEQIYNFYADEVSSVQFGHKIIFFGDKSKVAHISEVNMAEENLRYIQDESEYLVYKSLKQLRITLYDEIKADQILLNHNGYNMGRLTLFNDINNNVICISCSNSILFQVNETHLLRLIDVNSLKIILEFSYIIIPMLNVVFSPTEFFNIAGDIDSTKVKLTENGEYVNAEYTKLYSPYSFFNGHLLLRQPIIAWAIDDEPWRFTSSSTIVWGKSIYIGMQLRLQTGISAIPKLLVNNIDCGVVCKKSEIYNFDVGKCVFEYCEKYSAEKVNIQISIDNMTYPLFSATFTEMFIKEPVVFYDSINYVLYFDGRDSFIGDMNSVFKIIAVNDNDRIAIETNLLKAHDIHIADDWYNISIHLIKRTPFETISFKLYEFDDYLLGDPDIHVFDGTEIHLMSTKVNNRNTKMHEIIRSIRYVESNAERPTYIGKIRIRGKERRVEFETDNNYIHNIMLINDDNGKHCVSYDCELKMLSDVPYDNVRFFMIRSIKYSFEEVYCVQSRYSVRAYKE